MGSLCCTSISCWVCFRKHVEDDDIQAYQSLLLGLHQQSVVAVQESFVTRCFKQTCFKKKVLHKNIWDALFTHYSGISWTTNGLVLQICSSFKSHGHHGFLEENNKKYLISFLIQWSYWTMCQQEMMSYDVWL